MKKTILAAMISAVSLPALASQFFVVVPVPNRTPTAGNILVTLNGYSLPAGLAGRAYAGFDFNSVLQVRGDPGYSPAAVRWSLVGGVLPAGMALDVSGKLTGTPTGPGTSSFQVMASYKTKAGQQDYQVVVGEVSIGLSSAALPAAAQSASYFYDLKPRLSVSGDSAFDMAGVTWSVIGSLPPGLKLNGDGTITGTPTGDGTYSFKVKAAYLTKSGQQDYQVLVDSITVTLASATLPAGVQNTAYSYDLKSRLAIGWDASFNGTGVTWMLVSGSLPDGLSLDSNGVISGKPTAESTGTPFTIQATYKSKSGQQTYAVVVGAISISLASTATPPAAAVGQVYNSGTGWDIKPNLAISGDGAYAGNGAGVTWSIAAGALPAGLTLNSNGTVTGTPTQNGTNPVTVKAAYKGKSATQSYTLPLTGGITQYSGYRAWSDGSYAASCKEYRNGKGGFAYAGVTGDGVYRIDVDGAGPLTPVDVVCDMTTDGGGWTVFQRRVNGSVDFYRTWAEYAAGFGNTTEYWMGNDRLAVLTANGANTLRVDMARTNGQTSYATYTGFKINGAADSYRLSLTWAGGPAGDSLTYHNGYTFQTKDYPAGATCAQTFKGAWWYYACHLSNLNGAYLNGAHSSYADGIEWNSWTGYYESLARTEMKAR
ncbi:hypothetical protein WJ97_12335 [Burkholderia ubonensis]|uniref:fibrinogen-related protein n=1 Tax=Burkholderia ubonensis TaxID=101571 RepID=UPI0007527376|nr:fibrinogen-related protein [Burkholderia ubonensis]KVP96664.1 hypothetical protein WJ97_12335 [Burkholderia ubonensis]